MSHSPQGWGHALDASCSVSTFCGGYPELPSPKFPSDQSLCGGDCVGADDGHLVSVEQRRRPKRRIRILSAAVLGALDAALCHDRGLCLDLVANTG